MKRTVITSVLIFLFLVLGTGVAVLYAKGYRIIPQKNGRTILRGTGLVVLTSNPDGAKVYIDGELTTATNNTINLFPGGYTISIEKDGYIAWEKKVDVQKEVVTQIDVLLVPQAPKLESITLTGAKHPIVDPTGSLIAYGVSSGSAARNGIYVLDMSGNPIIPIGGSSTQISDDSLEAFSTAMLAFSPDGKELLATVSANLQNRTYRFNASGSLQRATNVSSTLSLIDQQWQMGKTKLFQERLRSLKKPVNIFAKTYFKNIVFSPEQDKILYMASQSGTLPIAIQPRLLGTNNTAERRDIEKDSIYVYDTREDRNYLINSASGHPREVSSYHWFPDSRHLLFIEDKKIYLTEYDGGNKTIVYAGPFEDGFVAPWPDGSRIVILTNLNSPDIPLNLYTVSLK